MERREFEEVAQGPLTPPADRHAEDPQALRVLAPRLPRKAGADEVDFVARARERRDLASEPRVERIVTLPDQQDSRHHRTFERSAGEARSARKAPSPSTVPSTIIVRL